MRTLRSGPRARILFVAVALASAALIVAATGSARATAGPTNVQEPSISGAAVTGDVLQGNRGLWQSTKDVSYKYQWLRCKADAIDDSSSKSCQNLLGATTQTYTVTNGDLGFRIRFRVKATNGGGSTTATSQATSVVTSPGGKPAVVTPPSISGSAIVGETLKTTTGNWVGTQPITYSYKWLRCDKDGNACNAIGGQTQASYKVVQKDVGKTLRTHVVAKNSKGKGDAYSPRTGVVLDAGNGGIIVLPDGSKSIDVTDVPKGARLIVDQVKFSPNPLTSTTAAVSAQIKVKDTQGYVVRGAIVFIRATPRVVDGGDNSATSTDGWVQYSMPATADMKKMKGFQNLQFFVKAYRKGDPELAGIAGYRLVQVGLNF